MGKQYLNYDVILFPDFRCTVFSIVSVTGHHLLEIRGRLVQIFFSLH